MEQAERVNALNVFRIADDVKPTRDMVALQTALASTDPTVQAALRQLLVLANLAHGQQISKQLDQLDKQRHPTDRWAWQWSSTGRQWSSEPAGR